MGPSRAARAPHPFSEGCLSFLAKWLPNPARGLVNKAAPPEMPMPPPLVPFRTTVQPDWIDYNGHMNVAYYVLAFDKGTDALLDHLGLGAAYRHTTNHSMYALEAHVTYERELKLGEPLVVDTQVIDADEKRIHFFHRMTHGTAGFLAATNELLGLHVDLAGPRAAPMPEAARAELARVLAAHRVLPRPPQLGRQIALKRRP
jgi:acyl-CoA thioester hydrolase